MAKQNQTMSIELVTDVKDNGELVTKEYYTPNFIPFSKLMKATATLDTLEDKSEMESMNLTFQVICDLYNNQFDVDELMNGLDSREAVSVVQANIQYLSTGSVEENNDAKLKEVTKK